MKVISPIYLTIPRKTKKDKTYSLNLNSYRNRQFHLNNDLKILYKKFIQEQIEWRVFKTPIGIAYTLYWKHKSDLMNVICVVDKFFCDALIEYKCIPDDSVLDLIEIHCKVWGKDRINPRVEIEILE